MPRKRKPRTTRVQGELWHIIRADHLRVGDVWAYGICDTTHRAIYLARWVDGERQTKALRAATLRHELAHAHLHELGERFAEAYEAARADAPGTRKG